MALQTAIEGARNAPQSVTWYQADGVTPQDLTGATITGTIQDKNGDPRAIDGVLEVTGATSGVFSWTYGATDVGAAGEFLVQFRATYTNYDLSFAAYWKVEEALPLATFPFSYDLSTAVGQIRLEIGDTDNLQDAGVKPNGANFSDAELTHFYTQESSSVLGAAARACEVLARMWGAQGKMVKIRDYTIDTRDRAKSFADLAKDLRLRSGSLYAGGSAPTQRVDGYSNDTHSQQTEPSGEYWQERKTLKW